MNEQDRNKQWDDWYKRWVAKYGNDCYECLGSGVLVGRSTPDNQECGVCKGKGVIKK